MLVKDRELASSLRAAAEANMSRDMTALRDQVKELEQRLALAEEAANTKVRQLQDVLKTTEHVFPIRSRAVE